ncbi:MAG: metal-dependent hydrolase [Synergistales bacterium]|nr:metal-dependent hydrolase [Synergistaceae bacterium]MDY6399370.1 metal-dependent hydrolase [Synergistales bacterium]MDY6401786.1 metal-dependent hydrolase [Synergistales bacterium]MDY6404459.1 metal-dependent hydrolase [Synergistales bacterium]MDY6410182.1 metal-dependent hydrolase [Synergistales bacterium]
MTGKGHRLSTTAIVLGATGSPLAALFSFFGSTFPDSSEYVFFGKRRNRWHRRWTHWFVPWAVMAYACFKRSGWIVPRLSALVDGRNAHYDVWACAGFWLMGCLLHILEDAWCGTVPFLFPWKRSIGLHVFHMSKKIGEVSRGERNFILCCVLLSMLAFSVRFFTVDSAINFLKVLWKNI